MADSAQLKSTHQQREQNGVHEVAPVESQPNGIAADFDEVFQDGPETNWARPRQWGRLLLALIVVGGIVAASAWGLSAFSASTDAAVDMPVYEVVPKTFRVEVLERGQLESSANVHLRSEVDGMATITSIVPDGTEVKAGEIVLEFDSAELATAVSEQEVKVRQARSAVVDAQAELSIAKINLEEYTNGTFVKELKEAEVEIRVAEENLRSAENVRDYTERMYRKGYVNALELEGKKFAAEKARLELEKSEVKRNALQDYTYKKEVETRNGAIAKSESKLTGAKEILDVEESRLAQLKTSLEKCTVRAPQAGMVVYANDGYRDSMSEGGRIGPGGQVWQSQTVIWLPDLTKMQVSVNVHESRIRQIHPGMKATVKVQDQEYEGEVVSIANQPDTANFWAGQSSKKYTTIVKILGELQDLKPGLTAEVTIPTETVPDALTLPIVSIFSEDGDKFCYVRTAGGEFERRKLVCGSINDKEVHVTQGLSVGDRVLYNSGQLQAMEKADSQAVATPTS